MSDKIRYYDGDGITVAYSAKRCIHAAECVRGLPAVFDVKKRPWIQPEQAEQTAVIEVVLRCPTGALQFSPTDDDGPIEETPPENMVTIQVNGPLYIHGQLVVDTGEAEQEETRMALCRCGASQNKPFCDNQHRAIDFQDKAMVTGSEETNESASGPVHLKPIPNGPVLFQGSVTIKGDDNSAVQMSKGAFCRCGASQNKPFCDGSHTHIGFKTTTE